MGERKNVATVTTFSPLKHSANDNWEWSQNFPQSMYNLDTMKLNNATLLLNSVSYSGAVLFKNVQAKFEKLKNTATDFIDAFPWFKNFAKKINYKEWATWYPYEHPLFDPCRFTSSVFKEEELAKSQDLVRRMLYSLLLFTTELNKDGVNFFTLGPADHYNKESVAADLPTLEMPPFMTGIADTPNFLWGVPIVEVIQAVDYNNIDRGKLWGVYAPDNVYDPSELKTKPRDRLKTMNDGVFQLLWPMNYFYQLGDIFSDVVGTQDNIQKDFVRKTLQHWEEELLPIDLSSVLAEATLPNMFAKFTNNFDFCKTGGPRYETKKPGQTSVGIQSVGSNVVPGGPSKRPRIAIPIERSYDECIKKIVCGISAKQLSSPFFLNLDYVTGTPVELPQSCGMGRFVGGVFGNFFSTPSLLKDLYTPPEPRYISPITTLEFSGAQEMDWFQKMSQIVISGPTDQVNYRSNALFIYCPQLVPVQINDQTDNLLAILPLDRTKYLFHSTEDYVQNTAINLQNLSIWTFKRIAGGGTQNNFDFSVKDEYDRIPSLFIDYPVCQLILSVQILEKP